MYRLKHFCQVGLRQQTTPTRNSKIPGSDSHTDPCEISLAITINQKMRTRELQRKDADTTTARHLFFVQRFSPRLASVGRAGPASPVPPRPPAASLTASNSRLRVGVRTLPAPPAAQSTAGRHSRARHPRPGRGPSPPSHGPAGDSISVSAARRRVAIHAAPATGRRAARIGGDPRRTPPTRTAPATGPPPLAAGALSESVREREGTGITGTRKTVRVFA